MDNPELTSMKWHHGHNSSIINDIPRIGFMKGAKLPKSCFFDRLNLQ